MLHEERRYQTDIYIYNSIEKYAMYRKKSLITPLEGILTALKFRGAAD